MVQDLADLPEPQFSQAIANPDTPHARVIAKCLEVMDTYPENKELNTKLDFVIGACALVIAKQHHGPAMELEHPKEVGFGR